MARDLEITEDGEVVETRPITEISTSTISAIAKVEIDTAIATARRYPRSIDKAVKNILSLTTIDEETAEEAIYALPRGGKPIRGPSVRLAETIQQCWGNCRVDARVINIDRENKIVEAESVFHDLETNSATRATVRRRIVDSKGRLYSDDMIIVTGNAACSIAKRNAILGGVPKAIWRRAYAEAERVIAGDVTTLNVTRDKAVRAFATYGVKPEQVFAAIGVRGIDDISIEHIPTLRGMFSAIKNGETTVEEVFAVRSGAPADFKPVANPLDDKAPAPTKTVEPPASVATADPASDPEDDGDGDSPREQTPADVAFDLGWKARRAGISKKAIPADMKTEGREPERDAWLRGWDEANAEG